MDGFFQQHLDVLLELPQFFDNLISFTKIRGNHSEMSTFYISQICGKIDKYITMMKMKSALFTFFCMYNDLIETLLQFIGASRRGLWLLHLSSLEELCGLFFSQNRLRYSQYISFYIASIHKLKSSDPCVWQEFLGENFCIKKSLIPFTAYRPRDRTCQSCPSASIAWNT